jgi:membrane protein DedA with SNARE-associated domain
VCTDIFRSSAQYFTHHIDESVHHFAYLLHEYGLIAVGAIVGLECLGLPAPPGETVLLGATIYAGTKHDLNIIAAVVTAGAAMVGRVIGYVIGHEFGYRLLLRYGRHVGLTTGRAKLGQHLSLRYGGKIIFIVHMRHSSGKLR